MRRAAVLLVTFPRAVHAACVTPAPQFLPPPSRRPMSSLTEPGRLAITQLAESLKLSLNDGHGDQDAAVQATLPAAVVGDEASGSLTQPAVSVSQRDVEEAWAPLLARMWPPLEQLAHASRLQFAGSLPPEVPAAQPPAPQPMTAGAAAPSSALKVAPAPHQVFQHQDPGQPQGALKYAAPPRRLSGVVLVGAATRTAAVRRFITRVSPAGAALSASAVCRQGAPFCGRIVHQQCSAGRCVVFAGVWHGAGEWCRP